MASVATYLNFLGNTEEAFEFYRSVFGGEFTSLRRMGEMEGMQIPDDVKSKIMHIALPITAGHELMGTDMIESMGHVLHQGNNVSIVLNLDNLDEANRLYAGLASGSPDDQPIFQAPWGAHFGMCVDPFGTRWMFNIAG